MPFRQLLLSVKDHSLKCLVTACIRVSEPFGLRTDCERRTSDSISGSYWGLLVVCSGISGVFDRIVGVRLGNFPSKAGVALSTTGVLSSGSGGCIALCQELRQIS